MIFDCITALSLCMSPCINEKKDKIQTKIILQVNVRQMVGQVSV